jgi:hypothetical protein
VHNKNLLFKTHLGYKIMPTKNPRWILKMGFLLHTISYLATKNSPSKPTWYTKSCHKKPEMDFEDGFFVAHNFVFGNKNPPSKPTWYTKSCHKKPKMDFEVRVFVAHNFVFDTFEDGFLLFL